MSTIVQVPFSAVDPRYVSPCSLWLDAADPHTLTLNGSTVSSWSDKSGNGYNATQATSANQPTYDSTSKSLVFNGTTTFLSVNAPNILRNVPGATVFIVRKYTNITDANTIAFAVSTGVGNARTVIGQSVGQSRTGGRRLDADSYVNSTHSVTAVLTLECFVQDWANASWIVYEQGTTATTTLSGTITAGNSSDTASSTGVFVGVNASGNSQYLNGNIYEIIVYPSALSPIQRQAIEGYLASKWGLRSNVPISHPYRQGIAMRPFQPPDIGRNLALWLDAADRSTVTLSNTNVTAWRDKSSNAYSFTGAVGGYPTYSNTIGGLPVVSTATGQRLSNTTWRTPSAVATMFVVMKPGALANNTSCLLTDFPSGQVGFKTYYSYANQGGYYYYFQMFGAQNSSSGAFLFQSSLSNSAVFVPTSTVLITANIQGGPAHYVRYNGTQTAGNILNDARSIVAASNVTLAVAGALDTASSGYDLAEFIIYDGTMTTAQIKQVEGYLATKWRVSTNIPTTEPYYNLRTLPATPLFAPVNLSNCVLWLDSADQSTFTFSSGSNVSQWRDKSGIGNNASPFTVNQPVRQTDTLTNRMGLLFSGSNALSAGAIATGTNFSMFAVARTANTSVDTIIVGFWKVTYSSFMYFSSRTSTPAYAIVAGTGSTGSYAYSGLVQTGNSNTHMYGGVLSSTTSSSTGSLITSYDGTAATYTTSDGPNVSTSAFPLTIGGMVESSGAQYNLNGYVHEVIFFTRALSVIERQQVEGYLAWKWGLQTLTPSTHPFKNFRA